MSIASTRADRRRARGLIWRAVTTRRGDFALTCVLYSVGTVAGTLLPAAVGAAVGDAVTRGDLAATPGWLLLLLVIAATATAGTSLGQLTSRRGGQWGSHWLRMQVVERVIRPTGRAGRSPGQLLTLGASDADAVGSFGGLIANNISNALSISTTAVLLFLLSPVLGASVLVGAALLVVMQRLLGRRVTALNVIEQRERAAATAFADDLLRGIRVLIGIGAGRAYAERFRARSAAATRASVSATTGQSIVRSLGLLISGLYAAAVVVIGGALVLSGQLAVGGFLSAVALSGFVVYALYDFADFSSWLADAEASAMRLLDMFDTVDVATPTATDVAPAPAGAIVFDHVALHEGPVLDLVIESGRMTGVVIPSPGLARSFVDVLALEEQPDAGTVSIGGIPFAALDPSELRTRMLVSLHSAELLPGSIDDSLRLMARDDATALRATVASGADQVIEVAVDGAATLVGERGERLSGGQRQRVALARALAADPPVLVLHDPTTAVDSVTEDAIAGRVAALRQGRTTVVVTSSPTWLRRCDAVVFVSPDGARHGTHAELTRADSGYLETVSR